SAARTRVSTRRSSSAIARLAGDGGNRRATVSGLIVASEAHANARSPCGSSAPAPFGTQTTTRGAAPAAGSPTNGTTLVPSPRAAPFPSPRAAGRGLGRGAAPRGTTGSAAAAASRVIARIATALIAAQPEARLGPTSHDRGLGSSDARILFPLLAFLSS